MSESTKAEYKEAQDYEKSAFVVPLEQFLSAKKELNVVQEKYDTLAVENMIEVHMLCKQRDEAMDMLSKLSHFLGCGIGDENTTAKQFYHRIIAGFIANKGRLKEENFLDEL